MPKTLKQNALDRDVDDIGRVLAALLDDKREPSVLVKEYVTADLRQLRLDSPITLHVKQLIALQVNNGAAIRTGGGGIVFQCLNRDITQLQYALKITRPSLMQGTLRKTGEELSRSTDEYLKHAPLSHKNVARVFGAGELSVRLRTKGVELTFRPILMEWIEGAKPLADYLSEVTPDWRSAIEVLAQTFDGVYHLHSRSLIHWDLKSDNILVDAHGTPKVTDIGNARRCDVTLGDKAFSTRRNLPPELLLLQSSKMMNPKESSRRTPVHVPDSKWDSPWLDLWMLARELNRLFAADTSLLKLDGRHGLVGQITQGTRTQFVARAFPRDDVEAQYALRYTHQVIKRLLSSSQPTDASCYRDADAVAMDLRKLFAAFGAAQAVEELQAIPQKILRLPRSGNAPYSLRFAKLYNSSLIRRTTRHLQLGTLVQVYPGGSHRRSEHIAGVVATASQYVRALYANRTEPFWRLAIESRDIDALLLAALLHDIGHMSFGHALEEMEGLLGGRAHEDYALALLRSEKVPQNLARDQEELRRVLSEYWVDSPTQLQPLLDLVAGILQPPQAPKSNSNSLFDPIMVEWLKLRLLHSIVDSAIDADKLDYLLRDAHHCGVKYADGVDTDRFFQALCPILYNDPEGHLNACIGVTEKGTLPVESMLLARHQMFMSVYWHHTARAHTAMLHYAVQRYVGTEANLASHRLDDLSQAFRINDDTASLKWLRHRLAAAKKAQPLLGDICDALEGAREKMYWPAFELRYERSKGPAQRIASRLTEWADALNRAKDPADFVRGADALRDGLAKRLAEELKEDVKFQSGEILIDIPPPGKDQVDDIWIWLDERQDPIRRIQDLSPLADAVRNAFRSWARRLRVFLAPRAWDRLLKLGLNEQDVHACLWRVLVSMEGDLNPQTRFQFEAREKDR